LGIYWQAEFSGQGITTGVFISYLQYPACGAIFDPPRHNCSWESQGRHVVSPA